MRKGKALYCKRCGKKVGIVRPKLVFSMKLLFWGIVIAIATQIIGQIASDFFFKYFIYHNL